MFVCSMCFIIIIHVYASVCTHMLKCVCVCVCVCVYMCVCVCVCVCMHMFKCECVCVCIGCSLRFYYQPWRIFPHVLHVMYTPVCVKRKRIHRQLELKSDKQL